MQRRTFCHSLIGSSFLPQALAQPAAAWDAAGQIRRRKRIYELHQNSVGPLFDEAGAWIAHSTRPERREMLWNALSLLANPATRRKGNAVVERMLKIPHVPDHFVHMASAQLLIKDHGELAPEVRSKLSDLLFSALKEEGERPIRYMGYNDNFPAMDTAAAVLGGIVLDYAPAQRRGRDSLRRLTELLARRGFLSEYTSATYSPVTLLAIAEIAEYAQDPETRVLAAAIEERIWLDVATHFHAPTNLLAGPHSRAYTVDSAGHLHQIHMTLYHVFGEHFWLTPIRYLFPPAERQVIHHDGDVPFMQVSAVWMSSGTYHPSERIAHLLFEKPFPFRVTGTSEYGAAVMPVQMQDPKLEAGFTKSPELFEYPCGELVSTTYMTQDYAVGSATAQFHDGNQTDTFFVNFRRAAPARSLQDISTIFCRYMMNDNRPGALWIDPRNPKSHGSRDLYADEGRNRTAQKDGTVLVVYQAKGQFIDDYHALRLTLVVPTFYRSLKRLAVGNQEISALPFEAEQPDLVWIEDDLLFAAFRPLILTNHGRRNAIRIVEQDGYLAISFYNYEGVPRRFTRKELLETQNGFVAEIGSRSNATFAQFQKLVQVGKVEDEVFAGQRVTEYVRPGVRLALCHSLYFDGLKYALVDGKPLPRPMFQATGVTI